ncbi:MAG: V-type ATP synthase subunit F [Christensenellaceae bacterium]|nr:V-type ATP synthase subunit F [Christensenellaceae bacterium]MDD6926810.1 V-type ATP synthase subunit F [bacterium]MDY2851605.1 V-type ATP synthase subunit F [Christensenellaceae bacterium]
MNKMAVVGDNDSIMVFKAAGVDAFGAEDEKKAKEILRQIAKDYSVIFLTEELAEELRDFLKRFNESPYPAILCIPSKKGSTGFGMEELRKASEKALGIDILFKDKNR